MKRSGWHIAGSYLLLSALVYLSIGIQIRHVEGMLWLALIAGLNLAVQGMFAALIGPSRYQVSIPPWRVVLGSLYAASLLTMQVFAVLETLDEAQLVSLPDDEYAGQAMLLATALVIAAGLCAWSWRWDRLAVLRRVGLCVGVGALVTLVVVVPVYWFVVKARDGGFLYGMGSMLAIFIGLLTLAWSLGPLFLFLHVRRRRRELRGQCLACGYDLHGLSQMRCPECGRAFTFEEVHATAEELRVVGDGAER